MQDRGKAVVIAGWSCGRRRGAIVYSKYPTGVLWTFIDTVSSLQQDMETCNQWVSFILWRPY